MKTKLNVLFAGFYLATITAGLGQDCITITNQPQSQPVCIGTTASLSVEAVGTEPLAYQWQLSTDWVIWVDLPGATDSTLTITNFQVSNAVPYRVIVTNAECTVTSQWAQLFSRISPVITSTGNPTNWASVSLGASVTNRVIAGGTPTLYYQWRLNGEPLPGQTKTTITLTNVQLADAGDYDVVLTNMCGSITSRVVNLNVDPTFTMDTSPPVGTDTEGGTLATWIDYDHDGWLDLHVERDGNYPPLLYHNNRDGTFTRIRTGVLALTPAQSWGTLWADYDNDGAVDVFKSCYGAANDMLFRNLGGGVFTRITTGHPVIDGRNSNCGAWFDYDEDGFLDLAVSTYSLQDDLFYANNGDGTFRKLSVSDLGSIAADQASTECIYPIDVDNDGIQEISRTVTTGQGSTNQLWSRGQDGRYTICDVGVMAPGVQWGGITWADYDNDGFPDAATGVQNAPLRLLRNLQNRQFQDVTAAAGLPAESALLHVWLDYDNDGWIDFFALKSSASSYIFCRNNGDGTFSTKDIGSPLRGYFTLVPGDYNNDGFQDLFLTALGGVRCGLFRHNGNTNHWLKVKLEGRASNRSGVGAKVRAYATIKGRSIGQLREITGQGFGLENGLLAHFGLGDATNVTTLRIEWPSGIVQELQNVAANQFTNVVESQGYTNTNAIPNFTGAVKTTGGVELSFSEPATNAVYILEASTDLVTWTKLMARISAGAAAAQFTDSRSTNYTRRFYRLQVP